MSKKSFLPVSLFAILLWYITFFVQRTELIPLFTGYSALFLLMYYIFKNSETQDIKRLIWASIIIRAALIFATPALSDDFYRFFWDGSCMLNGINPFQFTPQQLLTEKDLLVIQHFDALNSKEYFSIYPPVCQYIFLFAAWLSPKSIFGFQMILKLFFLLAEILSIHFIVGILTHYGMDVKKVLLYAFNPFIIIELMGNLHFEGIQIAFLMAGLCFFIQEGNKQKIIAIIFLALAINTKLLPLIILPLLFLKIDWKLRFAYAAGIALITILLHLPFLTAEFTINIFDSIQLYFQSFEFNASVYYILREVGYSITGFNEIAIIGKILAVATFLSIILFSFIAHTKKQFLFTSLLFIWVIYLIFATTVHPWYLSIPFVFSLFTGYRFIHVWIFASIFTYATYITQPYQEILWIVAIEYLVMFGFLFYELYTKQGIVGAEIDRYE